MNKIEEIKKKSGDLKLTKMTTRAFEMDCERNRHFE